MLLLLKREVRALRAWRRVKFAFGFSDLQAHSLPNSERMLRLEDGTIQEILCLGKGQTEQLTTAVAHHQAFH